MDKLKKPTKLTLWEDFIDHEGVKLFKQLHDYPIILARRIAKSSPGKRTSNRFIGLTSKFNTTIEINPPYPQAAELRTWIKTIEAKLFAYKMKSTTPIGSTMLIPFEDDIISVANIQAQPPGQIFNIEAELCLASKEQLFSVLACSNCKQLFTRYNVRREIYCTSCHRSTHLIPRCQFEVTVKDNSGFATAIVSDEIAEKMLHLTSEEIYEICFVKKGTLSLQNVEDQLNGKIFNIQMKKLFTKKLDATQKLSILSYMEKEDVVHEPMASTTVNVTEGKKRTIEHVNSREKEYPSIANKSNPPMKKN
ncbi:replication protein A 70 kDa DNA-binding subunit B-like isoform X1 [Solanum pennellii]|uniref:Replication protein A 70 kDa DNA-binding subunit B-like isoform X1 n=1 Tax=Solanum pennellii TaxID=28526 RepID=A0ABM1VDN0_SOLPN|nr:replication protein A 70 kDa DNA-binding subunit B-like isoform X1 [Solanum pennellii]